MFTSASELLRQRFDDNIATKDILKTYKQLEEGQINSKTSNNVEKHKYMQPSIEILNKYKAQSKPKNTQKNTKTCVISILLSEFVVTVKKRDDGDFKSDSLYNGICAINRQFKEFFKHQAPFNILQDFEFSTFRDILHAQMIELEEMNNGKSKSADPLSEEEMSHIFNHPALSCDIPEGLFRRIFLWIGCCSARRGGTYQEIMYDHFKKHDDGGFDLVIIHDKTHQGGLYHRSHSGYKQPLSHIIPPDEKGTIGAYLNAGKWFTRKHAGHDKLSRMLQEICTITGIDCVNRNIINHSIRKTIAQKLNDNGLDPQAIMNITLHRSITELNCYRSQNENQRITVAKLTLPDISDNDSKSTDVINDDSMNNDQDAISSDTSVNDSSISSDVPDCPDKSIGSDHAFNDISNITLPFKRSNNYDEIEGHKFKFIKCH
ncbi:8710_t:CDS:2 [Entrophospora sp. SA101]|nr:8710_t:CDS:2 [Entrophospora sp. SA101]